MRNASIGSLNGCRQRAGDRFGSPGGRSRTWRGGPLPAPNTNLGYRDWAPTPPMGWNSWGSYGAGVWEADVLANADYMAKNLKPHGWSLITIDIQWYEPLAHTDRYREGAALEVDANGRLLPAPNRFPMTKDTRSFKPISDKVHAMGLKLGVHLMRGIPRQAVDKDNTPILGTTLKAADHLTSEDGITNWKNRGSAYNPDVPFVKYTDGTVNLWSLMVRPAACIENGVVKAFTFAVLDVPKNQERGNEIHGSKIIVVPFDGEKFNTDFVKLYATEKAGSASTATSPKPN